MYGGGDCYAEVVRLLLGHVPVRLTAATAVGVGSRGAYAHPITALVQSGFCGK